MPRVNWKYVALFIVAYVGFFSYRWINDGRSNAFVSAANVLAVSVDVESKQLTGVARSQESTGPIYVAKAGGTSVAAVEQVGPVTALADTGALSRETVEHVSALSNDVLDATSVTERGKAITKLRNTTKTAESVQVLAEVLHSDAAARNRLFAVSALRTLATQGDDDGAIRSALRRAMSDTDQRVAQLAQRAYTDIAPRQSTTP